MLCCVMLYCVMLCCVMPCYVLLCYAVLCYAMLCYVHSHSGGSEMPGCCLHTDVYRYICIHEKNRSAIFYEITKVISKLWFVCFAAVCCDVPVCSAAVGCDVPVCSAAVGCDVPVCVLLL